MEYIIEVVEAVPQGRISERICEQIVVLEVPDISSQDRIIQRTAEQILDGTVEAVRSVPRGRVRKRSAQQSADVPLFVKRPSRR